MNYKAQRKMEMNELIKLSTKVVRALKEKKLFITTVESCTGGGLANALTNVPGASEVLKGARITYSNEEKISLGISKALIDKYTVYSAEVANAMAKAGVKNAIRADIGVGITGSISRIDPSNPSSIPGVIFIAVDYKNIATCKRVEFSEKGERWEVKDSAIKEALLFVLEKLQD